MLDESIQRLGRWTSNLFKLYFTTTPKTLFNLNLSFQKSVSLAVPRAVVSALVISSKSVESMSEGKERNSTYISPYPSLTNHIQTLSLWALSFGQDRQQGQAKPSLDLRTPPAAGSLAVSLAREFFLDLQRDTPAALLDPRVTFLDAYLTLFCSYLNSSNLL